MLYARAFDSHSPRTPASNANARAWHSTNRASAPGRHTIWRAGSSSEDYPTKRHRGPQRLPCGHGGGAGGDAARSLLPPCTKLD